LGRSATSAPESFRKREARRLQPVRVCGRRPNAQPRSHPAFLTWCGLLGVVLRTVGLCRFPLTRWPDNFILIAQRSSFVYVPNMSPGLWRCALTLMLGFGLSGCSPTVETQVDEQRSPHFQAGKEKLSALDYQGAIEEFELALEDNPRSALAHYELGVLF